MSIVHKITVGKPEGNIPFKKQIRTKQDIIKMYYRDIQRHGVTWIHLALNRDKRQDLTNMLMSVRVTFRAKNFFTTSATVSFSKRTPLHGMSRIRRKTAFVYKQYLCATRSAIGRLQLPRRNKETASNRGKQGNKILGEVRKKKISNL